MAWPSGMMSPWQNQADFWCGWSVEPSGEAFSKGQARVKATPPGPDTGQKYGLATPLSMWYRVTKYLPMRKSKSSWRVAMARRDGSSAPTEEMNNTKAGARIRKEYAMISISCGLAQAERR